MTDFQVDVVTMSGADFMLMFIAISTAQY